MSRRPHPLAMGIVLALSGLLLQPAGLVANESPEPSSSAAPPAASPGTSPSAKPVAGPGVLADPSPSALPPGTTPPPIEELPEPDYLLGDWELQDVPWKKLSLNGGKLIPVRTEGPHDKGGVPMRPLGPGGEPVYNPTVLAQQGLKRLDAWRRTGKPVHLRHARRIARKLDELATRGSERRWQPHDYDMGPHEAGWVNANSHGLVMSFLSRLHALTGQEAPLEKAALLLESFEKRKGHKRWFSVVTKDGYLWFEHWPDGTYRRTLNAHLNALFGLYDYWAVTGSPLAERYFLAGAQTVRDKLYRFRRKGNLSRYSLTDHRESLHYHRTHIEQLRILALMTGDKWFDRQAARFEWDERAWLKDHPRRAD